MNIADELDRLSVEIMKARLREAQHLEAKAATERRMAEMIEVRAIEELAKSKRK